MDTPTTSKSETDRDGAASTTGGTTQAEATTSTEKSPKSTSKKSKIDDKVGNTKSKDKSGKKKKSNAKSKKIKKTVVDETDDSDDSSTSSSDDEDSSLSDSESDTEDEKKQRKAKKARQKAKDAKKAKAAKKARGKRKAKLKKPKEESSSDSDSDSSSDSESEAVESDEEVAVTDDATLQQQLLLMQKMQQMQGQSTIPWSLPPPAGQPPKPKARPPMTTAQRLAALGLDPATINKAKQAKKKTASGKLEYRRVDHLWNKTNHRFELSDTVEQVKSTNDDKYLFHVRRTFTWEGEYRRTFIDVKSPELKEALRDVMDGIKGLSLVEETPAVDPKMLFIYLEDLRQHCKALKHKKITVKKGKKKAQKHINTKWKHLKVLLKYLDKDYADTKKTLYPMLEAGLITFDLLWALYKPNDIVYTTTYGSTDEPRAYKIEQTEMYESMTKGPWYDVEGKYLEYDGKTWGMGTMSTDVSSFKGAKKIDSLACYPIRYHKNEANLRAELIERGKKFVSLQGVKYRAHQGMAYYKKKRQIVKVNINGRIMVDPAIHRRLNPNYPISTVKPKEDSHDSDDSDIEDCDCESDSVAEAQDDNLEEKEKSEQEEPKVVTKLVKGKNGKVRAIEIEVDPEGEEVLNENLDEVVSSEVKRDEESAKSIPTFTDDEYLIASSLVLGFSFGEKLWLEFTVSGVKEIVWNEGAYDSLVLPEDTKAIVKALVESHKYHPAKSIDDVIQGKGKGLVAVLHGPPGTGKTLTAEGISELLKCPLYMVSAGELGTNPSVLEHELQKILDVAHAWGAVLLLDEADVFLEARTTHDIHRNALVSIFLRLLEYFQGILFLTTNRVATFDDAFQSRIHVAIRYGELSIEARKQVFKMFIEKVRIMEGIKTMPFTEENYNDLARNSLNGRQIKNTVRTAQALAVNNGEPLSMTHIRRVLDVSKAFDRDLKGGPGFEEALRHYF
ncbi:hypothetical protein B0O99DRAFT_511005 [Bisporella sp. PMI_857]|nr:hypothetical protein B0O99DRAFT_511005 [Bisporella sp. PMI_857]